MCLGAQPPVIIRTLENETIADEICEIREIIGGIKFVISLLIKEVYCDGNDGVGDKIEEKKEMLMSQSCRFSACVGYSNYILNTKVIEFNFMENDDFDDFDQ